MIHPVRKQASMQRVPHSRGGARKRSSSASTLATALLVGLLGVARSAFAIVDGARTPQEIQQEKEAQKELQRPAAPPLAPPSPEQLTQHCLSMPGVCAFHDKGHEVRQKSRDWIVAVRSNTGIRDRSFGRTSTEQSDIQVSVANTEGTSAQVGISNVFINTGISFDSSRTITFTKTMMRSVSIDDSTPIPGGCWMLATLNADSEKVVTGYFEVDANAYREPDDKGGKDWSADAIRKVEITSVVPIVDPNDPLFIDYRPIYAKERVLLDARVRPDAWKENPVKAFSALPPSAKDKARLKNNKCKAPKDEGDESTVAGLPAAPANPPGPIERQELDSVAVDFGSE